MHGFVRFDQRRRALLYAGAAWTAFAAIGSGSAFAQQTKSRIGVIGSGHIGGTIGGLWVKAGHPVFFASRHPEGLKEMVASLGPLAHNGSVSDAIAFGDVVF